MRLKNWTVIHGGYCIGIPWINKIFYINKYYRYFKFITSIRQLNRTLYVSINNLSDTNMSYTVTEKTLSIIGSFIEIWTNLLLLCQIIYMDNETITLKHFTAEISLH